MTTTDKLTDREWLIALLTIDQEQLLTDYEVHPAVWKGDPDRTDCIASLADGILDGLAHRRASQADRNGKPPLTKEELAQFRADNPMQGDALIALAAWVNVRPDQLPEEMQAHNCPATMKAWGRVAAAIRASQAAPAPSDGLREALEPFAEFARASSFDKLPDDMPMTQGSRFARRQVTAGDFKRALAALSASPAQEGQTK